MREEPPAPFVFENPSVELEFSGEVVHWRGPSPYFFVAIPAAPSQEIADVASLITYGWGAIPVTARVGDTTWTTSLFPRNGAYLLPLRDSVRLGEGIELGEVVSVWMSMTIREPPPPAPGDSGV
jgi:hypothetical protein